MRGAWADAASASAGGRTRAAYQWSILVPARLSFDRSNFSWPLFVIRSEEQRFASFCIIIKLGFNPSIQHTSRLPSNVGMMNTHNRGTSRAQSTRFCRGHRGGCCVRAAEHTAAIKLHLIIKTGPPPAAVALDRRLESEGNQKQFSISISRWTYSDNKHDRPESRGNALVE